MKKLETVGRWLTFISAIIFAGISTLVTVWTTQSWNAMCRLIRHAGGASPALADMLPACLLIAGLVMVSAILWVLVGVFRPWKVTTPSNEEEPS